MALPKFYADALESAKAIRDSIAAKKKQIEDLATDDAPDTTLKDTLEAEIKVEESKLNAPITSMLPILLTHSATMLGGCKDGHEMYYHNHTYYFVDADIVKSVPMFDKSDSFTNKTLPDTINLMDAFRKSGKDEQGFGEELKDVIANLLEGTDVSTWGEIGDLIAKHYGVGAN